MTKIAMKVLYCTDFTKASLYSLEKAFPFLRDESSIDVISVIEADFMTVLGGHPSAYTDYIKMCKENKRKKMETIKSILEERGFVVEDEFYPEGNAAEHILNQLAKEDYRLVIIGSRKKDILSKWLGSTSRKIAEKSHVPVFIARMKRESAAECKYKRVLFAVDGTENSYNSIKKALDIFNFKNTEVEVLTVKKGKEGLPAELVADKNWLDVILKKEDELAAEIIERACDICEKNWIKVKARTVLEGFPVEQILMYTEKNEKDLVIMGSHGREGLSSFLLGSVSRGVLENTLCPVVIIPTKSPDMSFSA